MGMSAGEAKSIQAQIRVVVDVDHERETRPDSIKVVAYKMACSRLAARLGQLTRAEVSMSVLSLDRLNL